MPSSPIAPDPQLILPASVVAEMVAHARFEAPRECCGLLVGRPGRVFRSARARNLDRSSTRYTVDPRDHFAAIRTARAEGLDIVGAYHSHPEGHPVPSPTDIAEALSGPDFVYVIVTPDGRIRAYLIDAATVTPVPVVESPDRVD